MSDFVLFKGRKEAGRVVRQYTDEVASVSYEPGRPTLVALADNNAGAGTCLGCTDAPCMIKDESELVLGAGLDAFPGDPSLAVCPTKAIGLDIATGMACVDAACCIGCGLCVARCPYGAIHLTDDAVAQVRTNDPDGLTFDTPGSRAHVRPDRSGIIASTGGKAAVVVAGRLERIPDADRNVFVRNLLHEAGMNARVRRRGDTNMRIDAVGFTRSERPFVAEIELVGGELESPRALMEDVAILHARYRFAVADVDALSIIMAFPNARSEYYQVMRDIEKVLDVRCRTLTIGALLALVWSGITIDGFDGTSFAVGDEGIDLADSLAIAGLVEPYPGAFKPAK